MALEKKPLDEPMSQSDLQAWLWLRRDNEERASMCLTELTPASMRVEAEENVCWAERMGKMQEGLEWRKRAEERKKIQESLEEEKLCLREQRWAFREVVARILLHSVLGRLESEMNRSELHLFPGALMEHAEEKMGSPRALDTITRVALDLRQRHPAIPLSASTGLYRVSQRIRGLLREWFAHIYGEESLFADA